MFSLTPSRLLTAILFVALFVMSVQPITDPDLWWHLRTGELIAETRAIPRADPFSFTKNGAPWVEHEWLANLALYGLYRLAGLNGLILAGSVVITLTFALVYRLSALRPHLAVFTTVCAALASAFTWGPRPYMLTLLFAAVMLVMLERARQGSTRALWWLPPLMIVWVNVHSGFILGLVMLGTALVGELAEYGPARWQRTARPECRIPLKTLAITTALTFVATLLNPNGVEMLRTPLSTLSNRTIGQFILEWRSPDFHDIRFLPFIALWLGLIVALAFATKRPSITELLLVLGLGYESFISVRNIPLFALVAAPLITHQVAAFAPVLRTSNRAPTHILHALNWAVLCLVLGAGSLQVFNVLNRSEQQVALIYPAQAVDYLIEEQPTGPLLNSYNFGGYLIWRLYPRYQAFIDGRAEFIYEDAFISDYYTHIWQARGDWQDYLDRFNINLIVIEKNGALSPLLRESPRWRLLHEDALAVVFQRAP